MNAKEVWEPAAVFLTSTQRIFNFFSATRLLVMHVKYLSTYLRLLDLEPVYIRYTLLSL